MSLSQTELAKLLQNLQPHGKITVDNPHGVNTTVLILL